MLHVITFLPRMPWPVLAQSRSNNNNNNNNNNNKKLN